MSVKQALTALADAIREKSGGTEPMTLSQMTETVKTLGGGAAPANCIRYVSTDDDGFPTEIDASTLTKLARCQFLCGIDPYNSDYPLYQNVTKITLSDDITEFPCGCFQRCVSLESVTFPASLTFIDRYCFAMCAKLNISLPEGLSEIAPYAFHSMNNEGFTSLTMPASVTSVRANAFRSNAYLTQVTFLGTPTTLASSVFSDCAALTDIYVPWAEGAVAGAPWGATNATVHYNS